MSFSLRLKITVTFLIVSAIVSGLLSYTVYRILNESLLRQVQARVLDLAQLGARMVNVDSLARQECVGRSWSLRDLNPADQPSTMANVGNF